jgi:dTDP-glucose pyrophosphorylase
LIHPDEAVAIGLPDTIWFPQDALTALPDGKLSFLLFPAERPELFDAVVMNERDRVEEIQVKSAQARSNWIWGAFKMPGRTFHELFELWQERGERDEYVGTLINAWLARGGSAVGVRAGKHYVDVGTLDGYRQAIRLLSTTAGTSNARFALSKRTNAIAAEEESCRPKPRSITT